MNYLFTKKERECIAHAISEMKYEVIPHPYKTLQARHRYEFPVTRKIIIEADPDVPEEEIIEMAKRCNDKEIAVEILGCGYEMKLSKP